MLLTSLFRRHASILGAVVALLIGVAIVQSPPARAAFPGASGAIVYIVPDCGGSIDSYSCGSAVYTRSPSGETRMLLDGGTKRLYDDPSWSADGNRLVYKGPNEHLWVMKVATGVKERITASGALTRQRPVFSPSGKRVMFGMFVGSDSERALFTMPASGGKKRRVLGDLKHGPAQAVYSPNGERVAFEYWPKNPTDYYASGIYTARLDGSGLRKITGMLSNHDRHPEWSPDGRRIAFVREKPNTGKTDIYSAKADGSGSPKRLTSSRDATDPSWSPDGSRIAYVREGIEDDVWIMRAADGENKRGLLTGADSANAIDWQPN